jgi:flagellar motility protein MotE (MotC chaperone)
LSERVTRLLTTLKEAGLIVAALSVIFMSGRTYQSVQDLREQIKKTVPAEQYKEDKEQQEKLQKELKDGIGKLEDKLDNRFECVNTRLDGLYNLILQNGEKIAEGK